jgi:hypothetical protein
MRRREMRRFLLIQALGQVLWHAAPYAPHAVAILALTGGWLALFPGAWLGAAIIGASLPDAHGSWTATNLLAAISTLVNGTVWFAVWFLLGAASCASDRWHRRMKRALALSGVAVLVVAAPFWFKSVLGSGRWYILRPSAVVTVDGAVRRARVFVGRTPLWPAGSYSVFVELPDGRIRAPVLDVAPGLEQAYDWGRWAPPEAPGFYVGPHSFSGPDACPECPDTPPDAQVRSASLEFRIRDGRRVRVDW